MTFRKWLLPFIVLALGAHAQVPQHQWWFFGTNAGLDMSTPVPTVVTGGAIDTDEGVTSIADATGQLLFYSDGVKVWDRTNTVMPNGAGLEGGSSSSQSALVVPFPNDPQRYYLFTVPNEVGSGGGWTGLSYSEIDMTANGGFGDVVVKNVHLLANTTEKLCATRHANGRDVWVVVHGWQSNVYHAYLITCGGILGPVDSQVGRVMDLDEAGSLNPALGCMQFDPRGRRLAATWGGQTLAGFATSQLDLLRFDNATGVLSEPQQITHAGADLFVEGYGVCFSPDGERLYLSEFGWLTGNFFGRIMQYTTTAPSLSTSEVQVANTQRAYGSLQKGPDGTIYAARTNNANFLTRITQPNEPGPACALIENAVPLGAGISTFGLPNQWDTYPAVVVPELTLTDTTWCSGEQLVLDATLEDGIHTAQYTWSTGATTPTVPINASGTYSVEAILGCDTLNGTSNVTLGGVPVDLGPDLLLCNRDSLTLFAPHIADDVLRFWSTGSTDSSITVHVGDNYGLLLFDHNGCVTGDTVNVATTNCQCVLYAPNAFTPNGDGINDAFVPLSDCTIRNYHLVIFDRWGQEAFTSDQYGEPWNGSAKGAPVTPTVMNWKASYEYFDGIGYSTGDAKGSVTVLH